MHCSGYETTNISGMCLFTCDGQKDNYLSFVETIEQLQEIIIGGDFNENAVV